MHDLIEKLAWPAVTVVFIILFRPPIGRLIDRLTRFKVFGAGGEARPPLEQTSDNAKAATSEIGEAVRKEPTIAKPPQPHTSPAAPPVPGGIAKGPVQYFVEQNIRNDPKLTTLQTDHEKVELLVQYQAAAQIEVTFERLLRFIFGSQIRALRAAIRPIPLADVEAIFNDAKTRFPEAHKDRMFDQWAGFLVEAKLGTRLPDQNGVPMASITNLGHDLILYIDRMGYPEPWG